jgi:hypothetical protein
MMKINARKIKIFKIRNRRGYAAVCCDRLTEGRTLSQTYDRMLKALRRGGLEVKNQPANIKRLLVSIR